MNISFKIFLEEIGKVVLIKGDLMDYDWDTLREKIIENSNNSYFKNQNLSLNNNDKFILEFKPIDLPGLDLSKLSSSIYNEFTFSYFISKSEEYYKKNKRGLRVKFILKKTNKEPNLELEKYGICLKNALNDVWKNEKENIKKELNEKELTNIKINYLYSNKNINKIDKNKNNKNNNDNNNNIVCNNCLTNYFYKYRYMCSYCDNYNLCPKCYGTDNHNKEHNFIVFKQPQNDNDNDNISQYDNKINPNYIELKNKKDSFEVNFKLANTGGNDLIDCFIGYINFDKNYLYCDKYEIKQNFENFEKNEIKDIKLKIHFHKYEYLENIDFTINTFEGHFRMFNKNGIPFGDILKIKVINENKIN